MHMTTHVVDVYRLARVGDKELYDLTPIKTGLDCSIIPAGNDILAVYPGEASFALYEIYFSEVVDIKNGDKLKVGNQEWIVRGVPQVMDTPYLYYQRLVGEKVV